MRTRGISEDFIYDLRYGWLKPFWDKVKEPDSGITLEIREDAVNLYYRGGSLLKIDALIGPHIHSFHFDKYYGKRKKGWTILYTNGRWFSAKKKDGSEKTIFWCRFIAENFDEIDSWDHKDYLMHFEELKSVMDGWFEEHPKREREYQHFASIANENILDIEYAIKEINLRLDMIMIDSNGDLVLIENKYGNNALSSSNSKPGLSKHYNDFATILENREYRESIVSSMEEVIRIKKELGLIPDTYELRKNKQGKANPNFHILFVLANLSLPRKSKIIENEKNAILENPSVGKYPPRLLCVDGDEYRLDLSKSVALQDFHYAEFYDEKHR